MNYRYIYHKPNNQHSVEKEQISHDKSHLNLHFWGNIFLPTRWCPAVISWFIDHSNEFNISIPHPSGIGVICPNLANINQQPMARGWVRGPVRDPSELDNTGVQQLFIAALFTGWPVCRQHGQGILGRAGQGGSGSNGAEESSHSWDRYERPQQPSPKPSTARQSCWARVETHSGHNVWVSAAAGATPSLCCPGQPLPL